MVKHSHWRSWWGIQEAEQRIIRCQGDLSHSPCPLRASGTEPALWSATGCDIDSHFHRLRVGSHPNATWEFLGVTSSCSYLHVIYRSARVHVEVSPEGCHNVRFEPGIEWKFWGTRGPQSGPEGYQTISAYLEENISDTAKLPWIFLGHPVKRALSAMRKHGG